MSDLDGIPGPGLEERPDVVALIVARRERYRAAALSADRRTDSAYDEGEFFACQRAAFAAGLHRAQADAMSALLRDMGVTE